MEIANFIERNEGALVGAIGGVFIAIIASLLTHIFSKCRENRKAKNTYLGLLSAVKIELDWQKINFGLLRKTLIELKAASIRRNAFVLSGNLKKFNLSIIESTLIKQIEFEDFNHDILDLLISYFNMIQLINENLDFKNANEIFTNLEKNENREEVIIDYFDAIVNEYLDIAEPRIHSLIELISKEETKTQPLLKRIATLLNN